MKKYYFAETGFVFVFWINHLINNEIDFVINWSTIQIWTYMHLNIFNVNQLEIKLQVKMKFLHRPISLYSILY
jgi:hypothetical protein